jgi:glycosyltransferase involved in cell wall biosynthesis
MLTIIIPALNEANTIANVVSFCRRNKLVSEVLVIDDRSDDNTVELAETAGAKGYYQRCKR